MHEATPLYLASVLALGAGAQWLAWRLRLPGIVMLLAFGFALGLFYEPSEFVEDSVLLPMVSLAVGVILFEGGLSLNFKEVRETGSIVVRLVSIGLLITWAGTAMAAHYLMNFSWPMATLIGALLTVSGPTVVLPLLRQVRPERRIGSVIKWEGIVNDPIGAVLAALVFEVVLHGAEGDIAGESLMNLGRTLLVGISLGVASAGLVIQMLRRYLVPDYLQNPVILAIVVFVFAGSNYLAEESGLLTVTLMGIILANQPWVTVKHVIEFKETLRVLLISVLFIVLSSRVRVGVEELSEFGIGGFLFVAAMILIIRPIAAMAATVGSDLKRSERLMLAWIHPRGIVAAAVASILATTLAARLPDSPLVAEAERLVFATFMVIVGTVTVYGLTLGPLARRLGLSGENPQGVLFVGGSPLVREIAKAVHSEGFDTMLVDTNPQHIAAARMAGLRVCYASIGSEYVHDQTDLSRIGRLLAMTPNDEVNSLAATEFAEQFGTASVYQLSPPHASERHEKIPSHRRGRVLFAEGITFEELQKRFAAGAVVKKTSLSDDFTMEDFRLKYPSALLLFTLPEKGKLTICAANRKLEPRPGKKLIALINADES